MPFSGAAITHPDPSVVSTRAAIGQLRGPPMRKLDLGGSNIR